MNGFYIYIYEKVYATEALFLHEIVIVKKKKKLFFPSTNVGFVALILIKYCKLLFYVHQQIPF